MTIMGRYREDAYFESRDVTSLTSIDSVSPDSPRTHIGLRNGGYLRAFEGIEKVRDLIEAHNKMEPLTWSATCGRCTRGW